MPKAFDQEPQRTAAERGNDVRARLLDAAAELIPELGWAAVSTRRVAERAGVTPGLVHYHFPSLPALLRAATLGAAERLLAEAMAPLARARTVDDGLRVLLGAFAPHTGLDPASRLFAEVYLAATRDETLRTGLADLLARLRRDLAAWLTACGTPDPEATAAVLAAAVDGMVLHRPLDPSLTADGVAPVLRRLAGPGARP